MYQVGDIVMIPENGGWEGAKVFYVRGSRATVECELSGRVVGNTMARFKECDRLFDSMGGFKAWLTARRLLDMHGELAAL